MLAKAYSIGLFCLKTYIVVLLAGVVLVQKRHVYMYVLKRSVSEARLYLEKKKSLVYMYVLTRKTIIRRHAYI